LKKLTNGYIVDIYKATHALFDSIRIFTKKDANLFSKLSAYFLE